MGGGPRSGVGDGGGRVSEGQEAGQQGTLGRVWITCVLWDPSHGRWGAGGAVTLSGIEQSPRAVAVVQVRGGEAEAPAALVEARVGLCARCSDCAVRGRSWREQGERGFGDREGQCCPLRLGPRSSRFGESRFMHETSTGGGVTDPGAGPGRHPLVLQTVHDPARQNLTP